MRISDHFNLGKQQAELDFVNIDTETDTKLFLDPYFLAHRKDPWSQNASNAIRNYFQILIDMLKQKDSGAKKLLSHLSEPNETCLGLSRGKPQGRGVGKFDKEKLYESLSKSKAVETGVITDIEDCHIFVDGFGKDKLSDMTTGIIRKQLIEYTQNQAKLHGIKLQQCPSGYYWDVEQQKWLAEYTEMLVVNDKKIILVPKGVVSFADVYTPDKYFNKFVLDYLQNDYTTIQDIFVQQRKSGERYVTKKSLKEKIHYSREYLLDFTNKHPEIYENFKQRAIRDYKDIKSIQLDICDIPNLCKSLINDLKNIPVGRNHATDYHRLVTGILELIFYPYLINPVVENGINDGRKRIDIVFDNAAKDNFFHELLDIKKILCRYVFVECKNYKSDPANPELDQLIGRFSSHIGEFGMLLCRQIENKLLFTNRCRDTFKAGRGLIIPLTDEDLILVLDDIAKCYTGNTLSKIKIDELLRQKCQEIIVS